MAVKAGDLELELIDGLSECVAERLPDEPVDSYAEFVRQYYHWVPAKDLTDRNPLDLCGAVVAHWRTGKRRQHGEAKVVVYNPDLERDGWHSPYTVVEIVSDDMPFIVDSVTMELSRQGYRIELIVHPVMRVVRDEDGDLTEVLEPGATARGMVTESVIHAEVARQSDPDRLAVLRAGVELVLEEVNAAVDDWAPMRAQATALATELRLDAPPVAEDERREAEAFLEWLGEDNFTFLGYREYELGEGAVLTAVRGSGLGILRGAAANPSKQLDPKALALARSSHPLVLTKANSRATVHRPAYMDYVGVKRFAPDGTVIGERRFLGLYTTAAYKSSPRVIPLLREKVERVMKRAAFPPNSHDAKGMIDILETLPRDLLIQISAEDLFEMAIGILGLGERQRVRLFVARDQLDRFVACTLCMPRDRFNTVNRRRAAAIIAEAFGGGQLDWSLQLTESVLVRLNYVVRCPNGIMPNYDVAAIEARIAEETRAWTDDLRAALVAAHGEQRAAELHTRFSDAFPAAYRADWSAPGAVVDIDRIGELERSGRPILALYRTLREGEEVSRCKLLSADRVLLSDVLPTFEHMGAKVVDERPYEIKPAGSQPIWVYDFGLRSPAEQLERAGPAFADAFLAVWAGELEDDGLNGLVLAAGLTGREVTISPRGRALPAPGDDRLLGSLHGAHAGLEPRGHRVAREAVRRAVRSRAPRRGARRGAAGGDRARDRRRRAASTRTGSCAASSRSSARCCAPTTSVLTRPASRCRTCRSSSTRPARAAAAAAPRFEIFVYSPRVEGIHLRGGKVARGGLRWSDRREDFRTEVLGLMKAQMVKNALIVPVGSKGGFVIKRPPPEGGREAPHQRGDRVLPDVPARPARPDRQLRRRPRRRPASGWSATTTTIHTWSSRPTRAPRSSRTSPTTSPPSTASGSATRSPRAARTATTTSRWGSPPAARGSRSSATSASWGPTSSSRSSPPSGSATCPGTCSATGCCAREHTRLLAAFNHLHVFLDPDPDPAASYAERRRLFELPRSSWSDYDPSLISDGGGVFERTAKSIAISPGGPRRARDRRSRAVAGRPDPQGAARAGRPAVQRRHRYLCQGGRREPDADAGDKANDAVRVDGAELRCRVVGEGGNLGFTQRGRIEYALRGGPSGAGGRINTDAIDNVAGRQQLRPRGQHQDPARRRDRRRRDDRRRAQRAAGRDDRRGRRPGAVRRATRRLRR